MKKILALILALMMVLCAFACAEEEYARVEEIDYDEDGVIDRINYYDENDAIAYIEVFRDGALTQTFLYSDNGASARTDYYTDGEITNYNLSHRYTDVDEPFAFIVHQEKHWPDGELMMATDGETGIEDGFTIQTAFGLQFVFHVIHDAEGTITAYNVTLFDGDILGDEVCGQVGFVLLDADLNPLHYFNYATGEDILEFDPDNLPYELPEYFINLAETYTVNH